MFPPISFVAIGLTSAFPGALSTLEALPSPSGSLRDSKVEAERAQSGRPPYISGPAPGMVGEELGGQTLRLRRFQVLSAPGDPAGIVSFYQKELAARSGLHSLSAVASLMPGQSTGVAFKRYSSGGGFLSHHFRWTARKAGGDLVDFEIVVEQPRVKAPRTLILLVEAVFAADRPVKAPSSDQLGAKLHSSLRYDLNGSTRIPGQLFHRFTSPLPSTELTAWYERTLRQSPSRNEDRWTFLLGDQPGDLSRVLVIRPTHEAGSEVVFGIPDPDRADP